MSLPKVKITHAAVKVSSVQKSTEFLQKALGLKAAWSGQDDWGMLKSNGTTLALIEKNLEVHPPHIGFVVDNKEEVDQVYKHLKTLGVKEIQEPKDHRDKSRSFYFKDPDGNQFELLWLPDPLTK
ncbi:MAG: glyoxalase [Deltaproteobacteria bacterium CG11_big_fil_rev_8_21_14_0_20_45_16]|nr:MAG: glyoxalase [Deltaproteobacteria bacterium CG11_big_fil_rev_8_21_14_0_20_45_16]